MCPSPTTEFEPVEGSCHCGAIRFVAPDPTELAACNCSFCDRVGALWSYCGVDEFRLLTPDSAVSEYRFNKMRVGHYHCAVCGCATHERNKEGWGVNVRMAHGLDRSALPMQHLDGKTY